MPQLTLRAPCRIVLAGQRFARHWQRQAHPKRQALRKACSPVGSTLNQGLHFQPPQGVFIHDIQSLSQLPV